MRALLSGSIIVLLSGSVAQAQVAVQRTRFELPVANGHGAAIVALDAANASQARGLRASLPVGFDNDGAVANEYAVVVCPTITYVDGGGRVVGSTVGVQTEAQVEEWVHKVE